MEFSNFKNMTQYNNRPQNQAYSLYAVNSLLEDGSARDIITFRGSYRNPAYETSELAHQYEDPSLLVEINLPTTAGPRRKRNELYEPTELKKWKEQEASRADYNEADLGGGSWQSRLILMILMVSLASLLMSVLIIIGKVGPSCSCNKNSVQGKMVFRFCC